MKTFFILIFPFFFHGYFLHTGDSLLRQLHTTLILHLTNNWKNGSMPVGTSKQNVQKCRYTYQIFRDLSSKLRTILIFLIPKYSAKSALQGEGRGNFSQNLHYVILNTLDDVEQRVLTF